MFTPENIFHTPCIGRYFFAKTGLPGSSIATSPLNLTISSLHLASCDAKSHLELTPGLPHELNITQTDELGNDIDIFLVTAETENVIGLVSYVHIASEKNLITVFGKPGSTGNIVLKNNAPVVRRQHFNFVLSQCPPGFLIDNDNACTCSASNTSNRYFQMSSCTKNSSLITHGFWVGYIGNSSVDTLFTGACVADFCSYKGILALNGYNEIPTDVKTKEQLEAIVCSENRKGILCGSCSEGYSTLYHSPTYTCANSTCTYGIPLYIVSELLPVTIIFIIILVFNISLTSGALYSFVFYAQLIDFLYIDAFKTLFEGTLMAKVTKMIHTIYASFNLKFFYTE